MNPDQHAARVERLRAARDLRTAQLRKEHEGQPDSPTIAPPDSAPAVKKTARQAVFLRALIKALGNITAAAAMSGIPRENHVRWYRTSEAYRRRFAKAAAQARELKCDAIEAEIHRRGVIGWEEVTTTVAVDKEGNRTEKTVRRNLKDTTALIFEAKAEMPEKYRERIEQQHNIAGEIKHEHSGALAVAAVRAELLNDPDYLDYLEYLRQKSLGDGAFAETATATHGQPGALRPGDQQRALENGQAPGGA